MLLSRCQAIANTFNNMIFNIHNNINNFTSSYTRVTSIKLSKQELVSYGQDQAMIGLELNENTEHVRPFSFLLCMSLSLFCICICIVLYLELLKVLHLAEMINTHFTLITSILPHGHKL